MGCDAPHTRGTTLQQAYRLLQQGESVIGPSDDGGYYFLGLCQTADRLFIDKPWGSEHVLEETLSSAEDEGLALSQLPALNDVDEWQDLLEASRQLPTLQEYLRGQNLV
jgi:glycosyltransferase A (GT-A) superfamily protein (DUF2064 family)